MHLTNQHKALLITLLITVVLLLLVVNLGLKTHEDINAESYYELEPEKELTPEEKKLAEVLETLKNTKTETNDAFNETDKSKHVSQTYKLIEPPKDYVPKTSQESVGDDESSNGLGEIKALKPAVDKEEMSSYNKVNELLKQQKNDGVNRKSSVSYSLLNRKKVVIPIPVYLCEAGGRIVINITVNSAGDVIDTSFNNASSTKNECLIDHALEYAKNSKFSTDASKATQMGTITFSFVGKN